jgi:hypothetical protein
MRAKTYVPVHGKGFRAGEWQSVNVFVRAPGFGPDAWIEELGQQSKGPEETADGMRKRLLNVDGPGWAQEKLVDVVRLEAIDR